MSETIKIPKANSDHSNFPCWVPVYAPDQITHMKPDIICKCGEYTSIGNHHVHADGKVTASYYHSNANYKGCGWHVYLQLLDYDWGEFLPKK